MDVHIENVYSKINKNLYILHQNKHFLPIDSWKKIQYLYTAQFWLL